MIKRLLNAALKRDAQTSFAVPAGQRIYAIGDIHGRLDLLEQLLGRIDADDASREAADTLLIFLGDLVDRGPDSRGVIERLRALHDQGVKARFLLGNHDEVFLKAASGNAKALRFLTRIGGKETVLSYGVGPDEYQSMDFDELAALFAGKVPADHVQFLSSFEDYFEVGDYLFVHAGIRPGVALTDQVSADLRWIRSEFLACKTGHGKMVVHGHSISEEADIRRNRIGIDTGAFASGRLTALGLEGVDRWFLTATGEPDARWQQLTD